MPKKVDVKKIDELLTRGVAEVIDVKSLREKLLSGKKLRVKLGIDPTSPNLHLGRSVPLLKMRDFQELGHRVVFIVGDFTGVIGDTSDKESERPMLDAKTIKRNLATYIKQAGKIIDLKKAELHYNSEWLKKLTYHDIAEHANIFSIAEFIARENIKKRLDAQKRVSLREVLYPLMQGYDSIAVKADVELGGTDQRFNLLAGREMQRHYGLPPQDVLMTNLVMGIDGRKMSSSWGNTVNLLDEPAQMFGKIMSMGDENIVPYFVHCTRVPLEAIEAYKKQMAYEHVNPRDIKMILAYEITRLYWGDKEAEKAKSNFVQAFQKKEAPRDIETISAKKGETYFSLLSRVGVMQSKSELMRLFMQGGVHDFETDEVLGRDDRVRAGTIRVGKKHFFKVAVK